MSAANLSVLTIGGATQDIFICYEHQEMFQLNTAEGKRSFLILEEGRKIDVNKLDYHTGGGATNSAVSFKRLGFDVATFFKIGPDKAAEYILQTLYKEGINTQHIIHDTELSTGISFIIPSPSGDRVVLVYRGANAHLQLNELPMKEIERSNQLYITSLTGCSSQLLGPIVEHAKKHNARVAVNPGTSQLAIGDAMLRQSLHNIDILILNNTEAITFMSTLVHTNQRLREQVSQQAPATKKTNHDAVLLQEPIVCPDFCFSLRDFFKAVMAQGPQIVVVTNGAEGVYVADQKQIYFHRSLSIKVINTLGAGDAFGSCFVASLAQNKSIEEALVRGIINSASVISHFGAKTGLLTLNALNAWFEKVGTKDVQKFVL